MRAFIFDTYGYYPEDEYAISFDYMNWHFALELTSRTEEEVKAMKEFLLSIPLIFPSKGSDIILSRKKTYINDSPYGRVSLVATKNNLTTINEIVTFHQAFSYLGNNQNLRLSYLKSVWANKMDHIEEQILPKMKLDDKVYTYLLESYLHGEGLAENAIQYLSDSQYYYGDHISLIGLVHKRMNDLSSYTFLNPFNFVLDSPMRDISDLLRYKLIDVGNLFNILANYPMDQMNASLLLARLLYPLELYDLLEETYLTHVDISPKIIRYYKDREEKMKIIKKVHDGLVELYKIRPLSWL